MSGSIMTISLLVYSEIRIHKHSLKDLWYANRTPPSPGRSSGVFFQSFQDWFVRIYVNIEKLGVTLPPINVYHTYQLEPTKAHKR